jgi:hypothetical protein
MNYMGDRRGGREGKKKSLQSRKKEKYNEMKAIHNNNLNKHQEKDKVTAPALPLSLVAAAASSASSSSTISSVSSANSTPQIYLIDSSCNLLSRQFENDLLSVMRRAEQANVVGTVLSCIDFTRVDELIKLTSQWPGRLYLTAGISPELLKKHHEKLMHTYTEKLEEVSDTNAIAIEIAIAINCP